MTLLGRREIGESCQRVESVKGEHKGCMEVSRRKAGAAERVGGVSLEPAPVEKATVVRKGL